MTRATGVVSCPCPWSCPPSVFVLCHKYALYFVRQRLLIWACRSTPQEKMLGRIVKEKYGTDFFMMDKCARARTVSQVYPVFCILYCARVL